MASRHLVRGDDRPKARSAKESSTRKKRKKLSTELRKNFSDEATSLPAEREDGKAGLMSGKKELQPGSSARFDESPEMNMQPISLAQT